MFGAPLPREGDVVRVRQRSYLVNRVQPGRTEQESPLVRLSCLDDDAPGEVLEVLWHHEVDARIVSDTPRLLQGDPRLDPPRMFGAYLHALRWNCVTSTDKRLLQAPFRAGIDLKAYQLEPLRKALALPRVNLFIADDVGLGKTIEAGLVMQELILRQRVDRILIVAPPAVCRQWQEEMEQRFGLHFAVYNSEFVAARRRERGWGVNPWTTHQHFIVSYALLRGTRVRRSSGPRTPHLELLLSALGPRADRSLLILDECHQAAPSTGTLYSIDSRTTRAVRQIAKRFEHRLFLSATPHNGHSNSFSALLELLDPQRFTRGVKVKSARELAPIMVRRLKRHLRQEIDGLPKRTLVDHVVDSSPEDPDIVLGQLLARYETLYRAALQGLSKQEQAARALVCVGLHKRLLSSVRAFHRTLEVHARGADRTLQEGLALTAPARSPDDDRTDAELDEQEDAWVAAATVNPGAEARQLLDRMRDLARTHRDTPDARIRALATWIRENLCPDGRWNHRRVVVFTEYGDTIHWLSRILPDLLHPASTEDRIARYHGGLGEKRREELKSAFNTHPDAHPLRVLLATDAAREGINLQAHCADLFHFDLPWNPSRIEQRNGRIDRVLQPAPEVRCHYFVVPHREEDRVLAHLMKKLEVIRDELGSLSEVISARLAEHLEEGIRDVDPAELDRLATPDAAALEAQQELEGEGAELLRGNLESLRKQLDASEKALAYRVEHLVEAVDLGLSLATEGQGLLPADPPTQPPTYQLPALDPSWNPVLAGMREPVPDDAPPWHRPPVKPVAFQAAHRLDAPAVQLHLGHPLVKRILARYRAQGFAAHDLARVTVIENTRDHLRRVVAFGRLSLFGHGATRLHEEILGISARVMPDGLRPFAEEAEKRAIDTLHDVLAEAPGLPDSPNVRQQVLMRAADDFAVLWPRLEEEAREREAWARETLDARGEEEAEALADLLHRQRQSIQEAFAEQRQLRLSLDRAAQEERDQFERDRRYMEQRLAEIEEELVREPAAIRHSYEVALMRFEPVGLVYLWPRS